MSWKIKLHPSVDEWLVKLTAEDLMSAQQVKRAIDLLASAGPTLGRPLVDRIHGSRIHNLKELRPGSTGRSEIRILFVFDSARKAIMLVAGDKAGQWIDWYDEAIPLAETRYAEHLAESSRRKAEGQR